MLNGLRVNQIKLKTKMKKLFSKLFIVGAMGLLVMSCSDDNEDIAINTGDGIDAKLNINYADSLSASVDTDLVTDGQVNVRVAIESDETVRRVYITQNVFGQGEEAVDAEALFGSSIDTKGDGSIDVENGFSGLQVYFFNISLANLPAASGTIVYKFWATKNKGDFRDDTKDIVESVATLTVELGDGQNPAAELIAVNDVRLFAPTADLQSKSFVSTNDGMVYALDESEFVDLWDVGYTAQGGNPQLTSAFSSPQRFFAPGSTTVTESFQELIARETGVEASDLNMVYFVDIADSFDFDGAEESGDLSDLAVSMTDSQTIDIPTDASGDIIAFIDQYGKKGVIRIDALVDGDSDGNFFEANDYVQIDIKVQP